jgi:hypothetical protein
MRVRFDVMTEMVVCKHPCCAVAGHELCRHCDRRERLWGEAMAALIDDVDDGKTRELLSGGGELGHVRAALAGGGDG